MSYRQVYDHCQKLGGFVSRKEVITAVLAHQKVSVIITGLDLAKCRGFYLSAANAEHHLVRMHGHNIVCIGRHQNRCWTRLVLAKEILHVFDDPLQTTGSATIYETVLSELFVPSPDQWSPQMRSEIACLMMALSVLCPESFRAKLMAEHAAGNIDHYGVALTARIPLAYVPYVFSVDFEHQTSHFLNENNA